jgi:maleylpyruvate isomerase
VAEGYAPEAALTEITTATEHLLTTVAGLSDADLREPSLLPGWTRGHVLSHLCRSGEALVRLCTWASTGVETPMYPSRQARAEDIEAGADRSVAEQLADLRDTSDRFLRAARALDAAAWSATVGRPAGPMPAAQIPAARLTELYVHLVDLDCGYTPAHWPAAFVGQELPRVVSRLSEQPDCPALTLHADDTGRDLTLGGGEPQAKVTGPEPALLAWLIGRASGDGLTVDPSGPLPAPPAWL